MFLFDILLNLFFDYAIFKKVHIRLFTVFNSEVKNLKKKIIILKNKLP